MRCAEVQENLHLGASLSFEIISHLAECASCRDVYRVQAEIKGLLGHLSTRSMPGSVRERVQRAIGRKKWIHRLSRVTKIAALVLIALGVGFFFGNYTIQVGPRPQPKLEELPLQLLVDRHIMNRDVETNDRFTRVDLNAILSDRFEYPFTLPPLERRGYLAIGAWETGSYLQIVYRYYMSNGRMISLFLTLETVQLPAEGVKRAYLGQEYCLQSVSGCHAAIAYGPRINAVWVSDGIQESELETLVKESIGYAPELAEIRLRLKDPCCQRGLEAVQYVLKHIEGVEDVEIDLLRNCATVSFDPQLTPTRDIVYCVRDAGYKVEVIGD